MPSRAPFIALVALMAVLVGTVLSVSGAAGMKLTATPSSAAAGGSVRIDGSGFAAGGTGQLTFDGSATGMPTYTASASGTFSVFITVPLSAVPGSHTVAARGISGGSKKPRNLASTTITVTGPTPTLGPTPTATPVPTGTPTPTPSPTSTATVAPTPTAAPQVLAAAGDIASCAATGDSATAALLSGIAGTVITLGDDAYESGTTDEFNNCYDPTWGQQKSRTKPAPGNHDYGTAGAAGYFGYFGAAAGDPSKGYYAYDLGAWRIYSINSNCSAIGGCGAGSPEETWLRSDLAANPRQCVLAYWHHPRFSSGSHGSDVTYQPFWQALYDYNADLVLVGHDHDYERFAPQSPGGVADAVRGIREFVVGTGGRSHYAFPGAFLANSEAHNADTYGVLKLTLSATGYAWQFVPEAGRTFTDSGSGACH